MVCVRDEARRRKRRLAVSSDRPLGVLLAGGKSTRLGRDKAWLPFFGKPLLCHVAEVLGRVTGEVLVSGRDPAPFGLDVPWLPDETAGLGPAGGVCTVLAAVRRPCLVVSCDLPFLDENTLRRLLSLWRRRRRDVLMTTYRIVETGYLESLVAVYEAEALAAVRHFLTRQERRLSAMFTETQRAHLDYSRADAAMARVFCNINAPEDLKRARGMEDTA